MHFALRCSRRRLKLLIAAFSKRWCVPWQDGPSARPQEVQGELDILLFGGRWRRHLLISSPLVVLDETRAMVRGGLLNGLHPGTEVVLYPVDTRDTVGVESLAKGFIIDRKAGLWSASWRLNKPCRRKLFEQAWVFVRKRCISGFDFGISLKTKDEELKEGLREMIGNFPSVRLTETDPDLLIGEGEEAAAGAVVARQYRFVQRAIFFPKNENAPGRLAKRHGESPASAIPSRPGVGDRCISCGFTLEAPNGSPEIRVNKDLSVLNISNEGPKRVYYTLLDIDARDKVTILLPSGRLESGRPGP
ncbi:MAG: hypothetical protein IPG32_16860 [Saprospirales bacterium]|nr:hypothetical protein [Saprospirales bacterium]